MSESQYATSLANSIGNALGAKNDDFIINGACHTINFSSDLFKNKSFKEKFKGYIKGYCENGGAYLKINIVEKNPKKRSEKSFDEICSDKNYFNSLCKVRQNDILSKKIHNDRGIQ